MVAAMLKALLELSEGARANRLGLRTFTPCSAASSQSLGVLGVMEDNMLSRLVSGAVLGALVGAAMRRERPLFRLHDVVAFARTPRRDRRHPTGLLLLSALLPRPLLLPPLLSAVLPPLLLSPLTIITLTIITLTIITLTIITLTIITLTIDHIIILITTTTTIGRIITVTTIDLLRGRPRAKPRAVTMRPLDPDGREVHSAVGRRGESSSDPAAGK